MEPVGGEGIAVESGTQEVVDIPIPGGLTKVTINLVPRAMKALYGLSASTGDTKTECINRAVLLAGFVQARLDSGQRLWLVDDDGSRSELCML